MGVYVYAIRRKSKEIDGEQIWLAEFAYKPYSSMFDDDANDRMHRKFVMPSQWAWDRAGGCNGVLYVTGYENGARIYRNPTDSCHHYDEPDHAGECVGQLYETRPGRFRILSLEPEHTDK